MVQYDLPPKQQTFSAATVQFLWLLFPLAPLRRFAPRCTSVGFSEKSRHRVHQLKFCCTKSNLIYMHVECAMCVCMHGGGGVCTSVRLFPAAAVSARVTSSFCI